MQLTCVSSDVETCPVPTGVSRIEPGTLGATTIFEREGDERFGAGTSAIVVGEELWIGSFRAQRLLRVQRARARGAGRPAATAGPPKLRLVRRCAAGRLRAELRGDVDRVRHVHFKFGRRLIVRDSDRAVPPRPPAPPPPGDQGAAAAGRRLPARRPSGPRDPGPQPAALRRADRRKEARPGGRTWRV